jgi:hypothetical protein
MLHTGDRDSPLEGLVCVNCAIRFAKVDVSGNCKVGPGRGDVAALHWPPYGAVFVKPIALGYSCYLDSPSDVQQDSVELLQA